MKKLFNQILDINNKKKNYPADGNVAFFDCDDGTFYIYALYTKKDMSESELIEVSETTYIEEVAKNTDPIQIHTIGYEQVRGFTIFSSLKAITDNLSVADLLDIK